MDFYNSTPEERARFYAQAAERVNQTDGYAKGSHVRITHIALGSAEGELEVCPEVLNPLGIVHGGCLTTLADTVAGCCACSAGGDCVTSSCSLEYLRPARGDLFCEATPKKLGRKLSVIQVVITDGESKTVATGTFTFFMTRPGEAP